MKSANEIWNEYETEQKDEKKRGGFRPGAGRKRIDPKYKRVKKCITLDSSLVSVLELQASQRNLSFSALIESILIGRDLKENQTHLFERN